VPAIERKRWIVEETGREEETIRQAILDYYHEGHAQSDYRFYENILHPEWKFFYLDDGSLKIIDRDEYFSWYDPKDRDPDLEWETEFYHIDVTENLAHVKLRLECQRVRYIDYFHMMKIDGQWWIVHKMSHGVNKTA
jgi:hypothetical protein